MRTVPIFCNIGYKFEVKNNSSRHQLCFSSVIWYGIEFSCMLHITYTAGTVTKVSCIEESPGRHIGV